MGQLDVDCVGFGDADDLDDPADGWRIEAVGEMGLDDLSVGGSDEHP